METLMCWCQDKKSRCNWNSKLLGRYTIAKCRCFWDRRPESDSLVRNNKHTLQLIRKDCIQNIAHIWFESTLVKRKWTSVLTPLGWKPRVWGFQKYPYPGFIFEHFRKNSIKKRTQFFHRNSIFSRNSIIFFTKTE